MPRTPDRTPGVSIEEGVDFEESPDGLADTEGKQRYAGGRFSFYDSLGEYDPRSGGSFPPATEIGQVFISLDGLNFTIEQPVTACGYWITDELGRLIVKG